MFVLFNQESNCAL